MLRTLSISISFKDLSFSILVAAEDKCSDILSSERAIVCSSFESLPKLGGVIDKERDKSESSIDITVVILVVLESF